ncbi:hypothetical protein A9978_32255 [Pseudomonas sp. UMC65]|uniref:hypothetical protein n=1 Tax=Pseudomonas sp. UMC65 TaxID=1862323 RepID=UPI00160401E1|nr:hypothetical protein [Pseudomonas sp. UMC65]MBB1617133.1 hypothetical protein [Pseudomonas sp. UMC65]
MIAHHDIAQGMLEGYLERMQDPQCSDIAVNASATTAVLIFRALGVISAQEDANYTEQLHRLHERRRAGEFGEPTHEW